MLNEIFQTGYLRFVVAFLIPLILWVVFGKKMINFFKKWQQGKNTVREYLPHNEMKKDIPTMGGIPMFIFMLFSYSITSVDFSYEFIVFLSVVLSFFLIGLFDDYFKVFVNNTRGISPKLKFFLEGLIGLISVFLLKSSSNYSHIFSVFIPLFNINIDLSFIYLLFAVVVISGSANSFNLTDGMDGLVSFVSIPILIALFIAGVFIVDFSKYGIIVLNGLTYLSALLGTIVGFLYFNRFPAKIFMGDSGSLMIGVSVGLIAILFKLEIMLLFLCFIPVAEALSVMMQVFYFKRYGRRLFKMAPIHHHFEKSGYGEVAIVKMFTMISFVCCAIGIVVFLL